MKASELIIKLKEAIDNHGDKYLCNCLSDADSSPGWCDVVRYDEREDALEVY